MKDKFSATNIQLPSLSGKETKIVNIKKAEEVKETKALVQAHELLWTKYNAGAKQSVITARYR